MKKIVIIDGQGGKIGSLLMEKLKPYESQCVLYAIGTNSIATSAMMKAGAHVGATGENPVKVNCRDADIITGPIGIIAADALAGEVTPDMAVAVGQSQAQKILMPVNRCNHHVVGVQALPIPELIGLAVQQIVSLISTG